MKRYNYFYVLKENSFSEIRYFGRTISPKNRIKNHIKESKTNCNTHKCNWIRSLKNSPILEVIYKEFCTIEEAVKIEKTILRKLMRRYNLTNSWDNCVGAYKSGKLVYQYDLKGNFLRTFENANHASIITNISDANILRACKKSGIIGSYIAGNYLWLHEKYNKYPYNIKTNKKSTKKVIQMDLFGNEIQEFISGSEAGRMLNIPYKLINAACNGTKKNVYGYKWKFKT